MSDITEFVKVWEAKEEAARRTSEYWKAEHTSANAEIESLRQQLAVSERQYYAAFGELEATKQQLAEALDAHAKTKAECERAWKRHDEMYRERYDALSAKTTEGMSAAEWQLRTGKAERERNQLREELAHARREIEELRKALEATWR